VGPSDEQLSAGGGSAGRFETEHGIDLEFVQPAAYPARMDASKARLFACSALIRIVLAVLAASGSSGIAAERVALVIGNDSYANVTPLDEARNDANTIGKTLEEIGFTVEYLLDGPWKDTRIKIEQFATTHADAALAVVYFAGHGVEIQGEHYLLPVDCNPTSESSFEHEAISLGFLLDQLAGHQSCLRVVILDACRNNPFATGGKRSFGAQKGLGARTRPAPKQTLIAYSANTGQEALDGMYTPALLKHLKNPKLRGEEVFYAINNEVSDQTGGQQEPAIYITGGRPFSFHSEQGELPGPSDDPTPLAATETPPATPTATPPPTTTVPADPTAFSKEEIETFFWSWIDSWQARDLARYESHYGSYFAGTSYSHTSGHKSMTRREWMADKAGKFSKAQRIEIGVENANYQTDGDAVILGFTQKFLTQYGKEPYRDEGVKILLIRREDGGLRIMSEKFFPPDVRHTDGTAGDSGLYSVITTFVHDWADAWEARDLERYSTFYHPDFQGKKGSGMLGYDAWMEDMAAKFNKAGRITVGMGELDIEETGDRYRVRYKQTYKSSNYSDVGYKTLTLGKDAEGNLSIIGESWSAN
jgi:ketosteroid isomerase-like protein